MGADGGTIPKRCELVKNKKKKEKVEKHVANASRWRLCKLSQEPLKRPIVACRLGRLYNKEAIINAILTKKIADSEVASHIHGLRDIKELKLSDSKEYNDTGAKKGDIYNDQNVAPFCCPVTGITMNGNHPFTVNWLCGCVISEKAISEVKSEFCHGCGGPFDENDLLILNPDEELSKIYSARLEERARKKAMKKQQIINESACSTAQAENSSQLECTGTLRTKEGVVVSRQQLSVKVGASCDSTTKKTEKRKLEGSVQDNKSASATYKSLFTTCDEAKRKPPQHWVTHNPLFY